MDNPICRKVVSMMSLYIENKLDDEDKVFVEHHFSKCAECYQKYLEMKEGIGNRLLPLPQFFSFAPTPLLFFIPTSVVPGLYLQPMRRVN